MLICPGCQESSRDWMADLDRCPACASARLVRRLGETECRDCGTVCTAAPAAPGSPEASPGPHRPGAAQEGTDPGAELAREVEQALARVLRRGGLTSHGVADHGAPR